MITKNDRMEDTRFAIRTTCVPLLVGSRRTIRKVSRLIYRRYGILSYALPTDARCMLAVPLPLFVKMIPAPPPSTALLAATAVHFFETLSPTVLPVLIDCTPGGVFVGDPVSRARLETHCFLSDAEHYASIPPFCYLSPEETDASGIEYTEREGLR